MNIRHLLDDFRRQGLRRDGKRLRLGFHNADVAEAEFATIINNRFEGLKYLPPQTVGRIMLMFHKSYNGEDEFVNYSHIRSLFLPVDHGDLDASHNKGSQRDTYALGQEGGTPRAYARALALAFWAYSCSERTADEQELKEVVEHLAHAVLLLFGNGEMQVSSGLTADEAEAFLRAIDVPRSQYAIEQGTEECEAAHVTVRKDHTSRYGKLMKMINTLLSSPLFDNACWLKNGLVAFALKQYGAQTMITGSWDQAVEHHKTQCVKQMRGHGYAYAEMLNEMNVVPYSAAPVSLGGDDE